MQSKTGRLRGSPLHISGSLQISGNGALIVKRVQGFIPYAQICRCVAIGSTMSGVSAWAQQDTRQAVEPVHWARNEFVIPFQVDANGETPTEVRLEVSEDQGQTWKLHTRSDARTRQFRYRAEKDGEFRFRLKTVDRNGNVYENPGEPLAVIVDTAKPSGELLVDVDPKGMMLAECAIQDAALDPASIRLEYQTDVQHQWTSVPCEVRAGEESGQWLIFGSWGMPDDAAQVVVRILVRDRAGNTSEWTRMPRLPRSAGLVREMKLASNPDKTTTSSRVSTNLATGKQDSLIPKVEVLGGPAPRRTPTTLDRETQLQEQILQSQQRLIEYQNRILMQQRVASPGLPETSVVSNSPAQGLGPPLPDSGATTPATAPPKDDRADEGVLYSNSRIFSLDYAIDNDPGASVANIELWGTLDRGESWVRWGIDTDHQSPFDIEVEEDGLFGFRMVIVGANGIASRRPLPGDDADAWVRVDTQSPQCRILGVLNGKGVDAGSLVIEYQAVDDFFGERPISFSWSASPKGPWQPLAQGARNNGRYVWTPDSGLPSTVYLRVEAVDAAGNVTANQLDLPVDVQAATPRGRFQGLRPQR